MRSDCSWTDLEKILQPVATVFGSWKSENIGQDRFLPQMRSAIGVGSTCCSLLVIYVRCTMQHYKVTVACDSDELYISVVCEMKCQDLNLVPLVFDLDQHEHFLAWLINRDRGRPRGSSNLHVIS